MMKNTDKKNTVFMKIFERGLLLMGKNNNEYQVLKNEYGEALKIYRGGPLNYENGLFFSNDVVTARDFGIDKVKYMANIRVKKPLIIDAKNFNYEHISYLECLNREKDKLMKKFYKFKKYLYLSNFNNNFSTDEYLRFARREGYDALIIINVCEGNNIGYENRITTDFAVWNPENIFNVREITGNEEYVMDTPDLSTFI